MALIPDFGVLGINARNLLYMRPFNKKKAVRLADSKLKSKQFLSARDISVPRLYATIRSQEELSKFDFSSLPNSFVLKPNMGFAGEGIIPIVGRKNGQFEKASGDLISVEELQEQINDILDGRFSISGDTDVAFFEQLIVCDERLAKFAYKGLPDVRVILHNLIPVMAELRLPTKESDGKANIAQGALAVGVDIARGTATHLLSKKKGILEEVPGVGPIRGFKVPYWNEILHMASKIQLITNLGYLAVDIVIDKNVGPVLLEINARGGLFVQIANLAPLRKRLERIRGIKVNTPEKGVRIAQDIFGNKIEKEVKKVSGKTVIGNREKVKLLGEGEAHYLWASVNPILEGSFIDRGVAERFGLLEHGESGMAKVKLNLADQRIQTLAHLEDLSGKDYDLILGRRDLQSFLIDPARGRRSIKKLPKMDSGNKEEGPAAVNFLDLDRRIISVDRQIKLLHHLKPLNLAHERELFLKDPNYNPQFVYPELKFDSILLKQKLKKIKVELDDSLLGKLFEAKVEEISKKIHVLEMIGTPHFAQASEALYGEVTEELLDQARERLDLKPKNFPKDEPLLSTEEAIFEFEEVFKRYGLEDWKIKVKSSMIARCLAGKNNTFFVKEGARFRPTSLRMIIAHEIETHVLTAENGKRQNYALFNRGFANYLETQEGLAIWNQEQVIPHDMEKNYRGATFVFVLDFARKHSFAETADYCRKLGMNLSKSFSTTLRAKRGLEDTSKTGAFTKDLLYFSGYQQVKHFVAEGGDLKDLYLGKYNLKDLQAIKQIPHLREADLLPHFLKNS